MSAIIIGGNECMGRTYCDLCAKYNITARTILYLLYLINLHSFFSLSTLITPPSMR